jgi:hypothetical protein
MVDIVEQSKQRATQKAASWERSTRWVIVLGLIGLTGCAWSRPIYFKNPSNGFTVVCGPFTHRDIAAGKEKACIQKAAEDGFVRYRN